MKRFIPLLSVILMALVSCDKQKGYPEAISLDKTALTLKVGERQALTVSYDPADTPKKDLVWSSANAEVAYVLEGTVYANEIGETDITVTCGKAATATCHVTVLKKDLVVTFTDVKAEPRNVSTGTVMFSGRVHVDNASDESCRVAYFIGNSREEVTGNNLAVWFDNVSLFYGSTSHSTWRSFDELEPYQLYWFALAVIVDGTAVWSDPISFSILEMNPVDMGTTVGAKRSSGETATCTPRVRRAKGIIIRGANWRSPTATSHPIPTRTTPQPCPCPGMWPGPSSRAHGGCRPTRSSRPLSTAATRHG